MKTITKNIVSLTIGEALNLCLSFITTVYIARILGQSGFGKISFALAIFSYSVTALNFGILTIGLREVARDRKQTTTLVKTIFGLRFFLALLIFGVMLLLVYSVHRFQNLKTLIILYHLALFPFAFYLDWIFQGLESMETISYSKIIIPLVYLILVLIFIKTGNDLNKIPLFWFFAINVSTIYLLIVYISRFGMPWISFNLGAWLKIMRDALPVGTGRVLAEITRNFPVVILGFLKSDTLVGTYSAAQKLVFFLL
ncbi:MAG: oligosaccharide flippase family protein, partial [candidate division WOR-3 bacterium]